MPATTIRKPTFEHHATGLGIGNPTPRISWQFDGLTDGFKDWIQVAYDIEVTRHSSHACDVFHVESEQSVLVEWPTVPLQSRESASVRVRAYGSYTSTQSTRVVDKTPTDWSQAAAVEAALLSPAEWQAQFITSATRLSGTGPCRPLIFSKHFTVSQSKGFIARARLYITALGVFDVSINGKLASDEHMAPGWTSYHHRLTYRVLDVTSLVYPDSSNDLSIEVGEGWYAGKLGFLGGKRFCYDGKDLATLAQLEITYDNGSRWTFVTDNSWNCYPSAILRSEIYDGEVYDASCHPCGNEQDNIRTKIVSWPMATLAITESPPVRVTEIRHPSAIFKAANGKPILDFGQNLVGKLSVKALKLDVGCKLSFRHAEVLENGNLGMRPLREAKQTDIIIGSGQEIQNWYPKFTFHGFRYVEVDGWPDTISMRDNISALVIHSDMRRRGHFSCSNSSVNKLHENTVWSMRGNFLSIPTDCPQRDERLGWTGDLQVFCPSASYLYDTTGMIVSWLQDLAAEQAEEHRKGIPPLIVPDVMPPSWPHIPQAVWDDACILTPAVLNRYSGDDEILRRQFQSMEMWLTQGVDRGCNGLWNPDRWQLGDWLDPSAPPEDPGNGRTDSVLVANAYLVHVTRTFASLCKILNKTDLAARYTAEADKLRSTFQDLYISPAGNITSNSQTAIALAIQFDLYKNQDQIRLAATNLERLIKYARFKISTGFAGTPLITHALTAIEKPQLAYRMLLEKGSPSWMYPVSMGATTIWERWDSMLPDGSINPGEMTSFNHYALGAIVDWLHCSVAGISPLKPGWKVILARPVPGGNLTSAEASFDGPYGIVRIAWTIKDGVFDMSLHVPPNSSAIVVLPSSSAGGASIGSQDDANSGKSVGSGVHRFSMPLELDPWPPKALVADYLQPPEDDIAE